MVGELLTVDAQIEWRGTVLGGLSVYGWESLSGWYDLPEQRGANSPLPGFHGSFPGRKSSNDRIITYNYKSKAPGVTAFQSSMDTLRRITAPAEDPVEEPLVVRLDGESLLVWARCTRRFIPTALHYGLGRAHGSLVWEATDPRLYSVEEQSRSANLAVGAGGGLDFGSGGLDFGSGGLDFGAGSTGGSLLATNNGHVPTWPTFEVKGPTTGPVITYLSRQLRFDPAFVVLAGQTMVIDTRPTWHTVEIVPTGSPPDTTGVSVGQHLRVAQWTPLQPDVPTLVTFSAAAYDAGSELVAKWRDAKH